VSLFSWIVAAAFILATVGRYLDVFNVVATPPDLPNANMVDRTLGSHDYFIAVWPLFLWTNLLFAIGFLAVVAFAFNVAAAARVPGGLPTFKSLAAAGGVIGAISSVIPIGAAEAKVFVQYCDCGFKETEIVSQLWAQMVSEDIANWFLRVAGVVLAIALVALIREAGELVPSVLRTWSSITAIALVLAPVLATTELLSPDAVDLLTSVTAAILVPVWAVWLGRSVESRSVESALGGAAA
jgi:hypothetical protein